MAINKCESCGVTFESEGHPNGFWLTECKECNIAQGRDKWK